VDAYEIGYLAGLIDGEGHIGIRWSGSTKGWQMIPAVIVSSSDLVVLQWCAQVTGIGRVRYTLNQSPLSRKEQYKWHVQKFADILWLLRQIVFHMHIKQDVAHRMIEEMEAYHGITPTAGYSTVVQRQVHGRKTRYVLDGHTRLDPTV